MKIHILTENRARKRGFLAEHGLSIFIEHKDGNILFDTGQTDVFLKNAKTLNVPLNKTDFIVLSHGHYDHCGGLTSFPFDGDCPKIYIEKSAFEKRYALNNDGTYRDISIPFNYEDFPNIKNNIIFTNKETNISSSVKLLSHVPLTTDFEHLSKNLCVGDKNNKYTDKMQDEQILVFDTKNGLYVFLGCSHPGVVNCLNFVLKKYPGKKIHTLVAGMHLNSASNERLDKTIEEIKKLDIKKVVPLHCTGIFAICEIKKALGDRCLTLCSGDSLEI